MAHIDDEPDNRHYKKTPRRKKFGIQEWSRYFERWGFSRWYATEKARDQGWEILVKANERLKAHGMESPIRKVER
jgi:hypothetical protein